MKKTLLIAAVWAGLGVHAAEYVRYRDFGAKGDGVVNDFPAIIAAHRFANQKRLPVRAEDDAIYYLGDAPESARIETDTDWGKAHFIVDDTIENLHFKNPVFVVSSAIAPIPIPVLGEWKANQPALAVTLPARSLVIVLDKSTRRFIRYGKNANDGSHQRDALLVDASGKIDPETPLVWDYENISSAIAYPIDDTKLTIQGGIFRTLANSRRDRHTYYRRNIVVRRSNTEVKNIRHEVVEPKTASRCPYRGFLTLENCALVTVRNCELSGRKGHGTYDFSARMAVKCECINLRQINDISDPALWGITATDFCKALRFEQCRLSRIDAHQGVTNLTIRNCELGYRAISVTGFGTLLVKNTTIYSSHFVAFRRDYGSMWRGNCVIRNCVLHPQDEREKNLFCAHPVTSHDFGYPCCMPERIVLQNLSIRLAPRGGDCAVFSAFAKHPRKQSYPSYPYAVTRELFLGNVKVDKGKLLLFREKEPYCGLKVVK